MKTTQSSSSLAMYLQLLLWCILCIRQTGGQAGNCGEPVEVDGILLPGAIIGSVVDMKEEIVLGGTLWSDERIRGNTVTVYSGEERTTLSVERREVEKLDILDFEARIKLAFAAGKVKVSGAAKYLDNVKANSDVARIVFATTRVTATDMAAEELMGNIVASSIHFGGQGTHVVTRMTYGARQVLTFDLLNLDDTDVSEIEGKLKLEVTGLGPVEVKAQGGFKLKDNLSEILKRTTVTINSDVPSQLKGFGYKQAIESIKTFSKRLKNVNKGKGVPIKYTLTPLCTFEQDPIRRVVAELRQQALDEVVNMVFGLVDITTRARALQTRASLVGLAHLRFRSEDFELAVSQYVARLRARLFQLLISFRTSSDDTAILQLVEEHNRSPFNQLALDRWVSQGMEAVELHAEMGSWIDNHTAPGSVLSVQRYSDLLNLIKSPKVDVTMVFAHIGKPKGIDAHVHTMQNYLQDDNPEGYSSSFDPNRYTQSENNALSTRNGLAMLTQVSSSDNSIVECILPGCVSDRQHLAFLDYESFQQELTSMGASLDASANLVFNQGPLVNKRYEECVSSSDPREASNGACRYTGVGDIPSGNKCDRRIVGQCLGVCGNNGLCQPQQCNRITGKNDWFSLLQRANDGSTWCLRLDPNESATSVHMYQERDVGGCIGPMSRWRWIGQGQIGLYHAEITYAQEEDAVATVAPPEQLCLQVIRTRTTEAEKHVDQTQHDELYNYNWLAARPCNNQTAFQFWELTREWGEPRLKILRPNVDDGQEYCVTRDPMYAIGEEEIQMRATMTICSGENKNQILWEAFALQAPAIPGCLRLTDDDAVLSFAETSNCPATTSSDLFTWSGSVLSVWGTNGLVEIGTNVTNGALVPAELGVKMLFDQEQSRIRARDEGNRCVSRQSSIGSDSLVLTRCSEFNQLQYWFQCGGFCHAKSCAFMGPGYEERTFCVVSGIPNTPERCECKPGWKGELCDQQIDACLTNPCAPDERCIDLPPPALDGPDARVCVPLTGCPKGKYAVNVKSRGNSDPIQCLDCEGGEYQDQDNFLGGSCTPQSSSCPTEEDQVARNATPTSDIYCLTCRQTEGGAKTKAFCDEITKICSCQPDRKPFVDDSRILTLDELIDTARGLVLATAYQNVPNFCYSDPRKCYLIAYGASVGATVMLFLLFSILVIWYPRCCCCARTSAESKGIVGEV